MADASTRLKEIVNSAAIEKLDDYIEDLYADRADSQIRASSQILYLLHEADYLEVIVSHESLLGILARTLRDEYRKSVDLSIYLSGIFCVLSTYTNVHPVLLQVPFRVEPNW